MSISPERSQMTTIKWKGVGWSALQPGNSRLGSVTILSLSKPGCCHHCGPSLHFLPCAAFTAQEQQIWLKNSKLPEQERKEQLALPAESTKRLPNSPVLTWTWAADAQTCSIFALSFIQITKFGGCSKKPTWQQRVAGENIQQNASWVPVLGTVVMMRKADGRYLSLLCYSCIK